MRQRHPDSGGAGYDRVGSESGFVSLITQISTEQHVGRRVTIWGWPGCRREPSPRAAGPTQGAHRPRGLGVRAADPELPTFSLR